MDRRFDAWAVALTGQLSLILIGATVLAWLAAALLLQRYRRQVRDSMRRRSASDLLEIKGYFPPEPAPLPNPAPLSFSFIDRESAPRRAKADKLYDQARRRRWITALIHAISGIGFAATMSAAMLLAENDAFELLRFAYLTWANGWPIMIATGLIVGPSLRSQLFGLLGYFALGAILGTLLLVRGRPSSIAQLLQLWLEHNASATLLLALFFQRRLRAAGPLTLIFMILALAGASFAPSLISNQPRILRALAEINFSLGLGATGLGIALQAIGFGAGALLGCLIFELLRQLYENRTISEQAINVDAMWLLFGIVNSLALGLAGPRWLASPLAAFAVYKLTGMLLFTLLGIARRAQRSGKRLLVLRVTALGQRSERLYDRLGKSWRTIGSLQIVAGAGLAASAIEPHEFLDYVSGKLDRRFIDTPRTLDRLMDRMELRADREGQHRVTEFFCHDDTWKMTLARLADDSDAVLMDLRGLSRADVGCVFEIDELFNIVALARVVFAVDERTDQGFMRQTMEQAWRHTKYRSPNHRLAAGVVALVQLGDANQDSMPDLLYAICNAASAETTSPAPARF